MKKVIMVMLLLTITTAPVVAKEGFYTGYGLVENSFLRNDLAPLKTGFGWELVVGHDFGPLALEGKYLRTYHLSEPGFADAHLSGTTADILVPLHTRAVREGRSKYIDRSVISLFGGYGFYDLQFNTADRLEGRGYSLGLAFVFYFNERVAEYINISYRNIEYDRLNGSTISPTRDGSAASLEIGLIF